MLCSDVVFGCCVWMLCSVDAAIIPGQPDNRRRTLLSSCSVLFCGSIIIMRVRSVAQVCLLIQVYVINERGRSEGEESEG